MISTQTISEIIKMTEYNVTCNSQKDLASAFCLLAEKGSNLGFELEAVLSEEAYAARESIINFLPYLSRVEGMDLAEREKSLMIGLLAAWGLAEIQKVLPFSSYVYNGFSKEWKLEHEFPDFSDSCSWDFERDVIAPFKENVTGLPWLLKGHRPYGVRAEGVDQPRAIRQCKEIVEALVPEHSKIRKLSVQLEPQEHSGDYFSWVEYGASMFYPTDENGGVTFFTSGDGDMKEELKKFFNFNDLGFSFDRGGR